MKRLLLVTCSAVITACASSKPDATQALDSWVGASETELVSRWGTPTRTHENAGRRFVVFESRSSMLFPGTAGATTDAGSFSGSSGLTVYLSCVTTFELKASKVVRASSQGNGCSSKRMQLPFAR